MEGLFDISNQDQEGLDLFSDGEDNDNTPQNKEDELFEENKQEDKNKDNNNKAAENNVDPEDLFDSESVGSELDSLKQEDTNSGKGGSSPKIYSSIATALQKDGVFPELTEEDLEGVEDADAFGELINTLVNKRVGEVNSGIKAALEVGYEPNDIKNLQGSIQYLQGITDEALEDESDKGLDLRKRIIYQDYINKGFSVERATRETTKSVNAGTDIEDAKEAKASNLEHFTNEFNSIVESSKKEIEDNKRKMLENATKLKEAFLTTVEPFPGIKLDKAARQRGYEAVTKPIFTDENGNKLTAIQKKAHENIVEFQHKMGIIWELTNGLENINKVIDKKARTKVSSHLRELENTINNTARTPNGTLDYTAGVDDNASWSNIEIDI